MRCSAKLLRSGALLIRGPFKGGFRSDPGLYVGIAAVRRRCRRDLAIPEGLYDRADLEARRFLRGAAQFRSCDERWGSRRGTASKMRLPPASGSPPNSISGEFRQHAWPRSWSASSASSSSWSTPWRGVSGAACRLPALDAVLINRREAPGRRHFDLAHEVFHILTWDTMPPEHIEVASEQSKNRVEQLANSFASAILMPQAVLDQLRPVAGQRPRRSPQCGCQRACRYGNSAEVALMALDRLDRAATARQVPDAALRNNGCAAGRRRPATAVVFKRPFVEVMARAVPMWGPDRPRRAADLLDMTLGRILANSAQRMVSKPHSICDGVQPGGVGTEAPMNAPLRSVNVRSSIVAAFRRDRVGPVPEDADLARNDQYLWWQVAELATTAISCAIAPARERQRRSVSEVHQGDALVIRPFLQAVQSTGSD